jgi:hypothetical protein
MAKLKKADDWEGRFRAGAAFIRNWGWKTLAKAPGAIGYSDKRAYNKRLENLTSSTQVLCEYINLIHSDNNSRLDMLYRFLYDFMWYTALVGSGGTGISREPIAYHFKGSGSRGGVKSGEARRAKRAVTWEPPALEMAIRYRLQHPKSSQALVAEHLLDQRSPSMPKDFKTLKDFVSRAEREGRLPRRQR